MNFKRKSNWRADIATGVLDPDEKVKMWVLPVGCICQLARVCGMNIIQNGTYDAANSFLGNALHDAGISGNFLFYTTEVIPQNSPRWLTFWLSTDPNEYDDKLKTITITTLGQDPKIPLPFQVDVIRPIEMTAREVMETIKQKSKNAAISQFLVETKDSSYRMEPVRRIEGTIIDANDYGYVVKVSTGHICQIERVSRRIQHQLKHSNLRRDDLIGTQVKIEYTMFTEGNRLCGYKSPVIFRSVALDNLDLANGVTITTPYESNPLFKFRGNARKPLLTTSRCRRSLVKESGEFIELIDTESGDLLLQIGGEPESGMYVATFLKDDETVYKKLDSPMFAIDSIDPGALVDIMTGPIFYATGYSLKAIGLCYEDKTMVA